MIKKGFRLLLFVFIFAVGVIYLRFGCGESNAIDVMPKVVGSASTDSIRINFCTMDTTYYPAVLDADSLIILIYPPDNATPESTADGGAGVFNLTTGYYQYHRRGSNATPDLGVYTVCVKAWRGEAVRGIGVCSYYVTGAGTYHYGVQDSTRDLAGVPDSTLGDVSDLANHKVGVYADSMKDDLITSGKIAASAIGNSEIATDAIGNTELQANTINASELGITAVQEISADVKALWGDTLTYLVAFRDSVNNAIADANKTNFKATDLSNEIDSSLAVLYDRTNDSNFVRLISHLLLHDSVTIDNSNAWDLSGGTDLSKEVDSLLAVLYDRTNDSNFVRLIAHLILHGEVDANMVKISGDATAANNAEYFFDGTGIAQDLDIKMRSLYVQNDIGDAVTFEATGASTDGFKCIGSGAGSYDMSADIHGTIDRVTVSDSTTGVARVDSVRYVDTLGTAVSAASCTGPGIRTVILELLSDADSSTGINDVRIIAYDSTTGAWFARCHTNSSGLCTLSLNDVAYTVHMQDPPNSISSPVYPHISSDTTLTYYVTVFDPGSPPSGDKCRVWCLISDLTSDWMEGCRLSVWIPKRYYPVTLGATLISPYTVSATSNDTGYVYIDVYESGELTAGSGETIKMYIVARAPNGEFLGRVFVEIPDVSDWEITW